MTIKNTFLIDNLPEMIHIFNLFFYNGNDYINKKVFILEKLLYITIFDNKNYFKKTNEKQPKFKYR